MRREMSSDCWCLHTGHARHLGPWYDERFRSCPRTESTNNIIKLQLTYHAHNITMQHFTFMAKLASKASRWLGISTSFFTRSSLRSKTVLAVAGNYLKRIYLRVIAPSQVQWRCFTILRYTHSRMTSTNDNNNFSKQQYRPTVLKLHSIPNKQPTNQSISESQAYTYINYLTLLQGVFTPKTFWHCPNTVPHWMC